MTLRIAVPARFAIGAVATACLLTACAGTGAAGQEDGVASLATASSAATAEKTPAGSPAETPPDTPSDTPSKTPDAESRRPQLRLDSSAEEITKYRKAYAACLDENGMPSDGDRSTPAGKAALAACEDKVPLLPPEFDPEQNPDYARSVRVQVKCMQEHGFKVHITPATGSDPNAIGWTYDSLPGPGVDIEKIQDDCRVKGFGGGRELRPGPA